MKFTNADKKKLLTKLRKAVANASLNSVRKDLGLGSHNTVRRWLINGVIPNKQVANVAKVLR